VRFMGRSLHFGGEGALLTALLQCSQEPSGRRNGRFSATTRERRAGPIARVAMVSVIPKPLKEKAMHRSKCVEGLSLLKKSL
jgi:hypothetical protein